MNSLQPQRRASALRRLTFSALCISLGAASSCGRPSTVPPPRRVSEEPTVRVGLAVEAGSVEIGANGRAAATSGGDPVLRIGPGDAVNIVYEGSGISVRAGNETRHYESLTFVSVTEDRFVTVNNVAYRGTVEVYQQGSGVTVVNQLALEDYLQGVVGAELGSVSREESAAVDAQAVASRTYALRNLGRFGSQGFDMMAGTADQAYGGVASENDASLQSVRSTAGVVLTYSGGIATPFFHSTCGYATAEPEEVFRSVRPQPYLRSVSDRKPGGGFYNDISPRFSWEVEWDGEELQRTLRRTLPRVLGVSPDDVGRVNGVWVRRIGPSGRAVEVRVSVDQGEIPVFGPDIRSVFITPDGRPLGSTAVEFVEHREEGRLARVVAVGTGWGHGVGLCQWGAIGRSRAGQDVQTILKTYFPGVALERMY